MTHSTNRQIFFILFLSLTSYGVIDISRSMAQSAGTGSWIPLLVAALVFALFAAIIVSLNNMHKGMMLFEYSKLLIGTPATYVISIFYVGYFVMMAVFLINRMSSLLKYDFFPKTPMVAMAALSIPIFCYIGYKGIKTLSRMCEFIGLIFVITSLAVHVFMLTQGNLDNIRPVFNAAEIGSYAGAVKEAAIPFLGIEILLIIPMSKQNHKHCVKTAFWTLIAIGVFYVLIVDSCIMKLGKNNILSHNDSLVKAIRDISFPNLNFFERMDIIFLTVGFMGLYLGISVLFTSMTEHISKMIPKAKRPVIVVAVGITIFVLTVLSNLYPEFPKLVTELGLYLGLAACALIPSILLITAKIKKPRSKAPKS